MHLVLIRIGHAGKIVCLVGTYGGAQLSREEMHKDIAGKEQHLERAAFKADNVRSEASVETSTTQQGSEADIAEQQFTSSAPVAELSELSAPKHLTPENYNVQNDMQSGLGIPPGAELTTTRSSPSILSRLGNHLSRVAKAAYKPDSSDESFGQSALRIAKQLSLGLPAMIGLMYVLEHTTGMKFGNAGSDEIESFLRKSPVAAAAVISVVGPAIEEALFRVIPSVCTDFISGGKTIGKSAWAVGIPVSAMFALAHNLTSNPAHAIELGNGLYLSTNFVPLPQLLLGAYLWHNMRQQGMRSPFFAHSLVNGAATAFVLAQMLLH